MYAENEILFPHALIPSLRDVRGKGWASLVDHVLTLSPYHEESLGFMLMMMRLNGCLPCETDSFRAMRGCPACALQTLRRFKGSDDDLYQLFTQALTEVRGYAGQHPHLPIVPTNIEVKERGQGLGIGD